MEYLCSECSTQLSDFEIELNELYPVGKLYCEFCQNKHERKIIKKMAEDFANELEFMILRNNYFRQILFLVMLIVWQEDEEGHQ